MLEFGVTPEVITTVGTLGMVALGMAFTAKQKAWIRERDQNQCQFPVEHTNTSYTPCGRTEHLQCHHVTPQRWAREVLHWKDEKIDSADNGITLCFDHHQNVVHEDMPLARANYKRHKNSFAEAFAERNRKCQNQQTYWNTAWDNLFKRVVAARNKLFKKPFPKK